MVEKKTGITQAILNVMEEVKGIDKSTTVGTGYNSYKGVSDKDVKEIIGKAMQKNGLVILPIGIEEEVESNYYEEEYKGQVKQKASRFTRVKTKYKLLHESGEYEILEGYGQGVDTQDKGAGKATTYALKYTLLYTFLVPTGKIDDTDNTHSDDIAIPKQKPKFTTEKLKNMKEWAKDKTKEEILKQLEEVKQKYEISSIMAEELNLFVKNLK